MAQPIWQTPPGSLGTIPEEVFYATTLLAVDPENPSKPIKYQQISGELPGGIQISTNGIVEGVPVNTLLVKGVPFAVSDDYTTKFTVRAYTEKVVSGQILVDRFADRTFTLTIAGQDVPSFITPSGLIATFTDAGPASVQVEYFDTDVDDDLVCSVAAGSLPPGLTIDNSGLISGIISPIAASTLYSFSVAISDGKSSNLRSFSIQVNKSDQTRPFLLNAIPSNIGTYRSDNFFAYQFQGFDFGEQTLEYVLVSLDSSIDIPPGTVLDSETGWLYGYIPDLGLTENTYRFQIQVRELENPELASPVYDFSVKITGFVDTNIVWLTQSDLGTINNGEISTLKVEAVNFANRSLQYQLAPSSPGDIIYNKLPQALTLLPSGDIAGQVSFNTFALDSGATTFDRNIKTRLVTQETTFDTTFNFTVNAYSPDGLINVFKDFSIRIIRKYNKPFENLYVKAMPPVSDRELINSLLQNSDIFPTKLIYRNQDSNFGIAKNVVYEHAFGLTSSTIEKYVSSLYKNHYWKTLTLGDIETAQAVDTDGNVIYEVVYSKIIGGLLNNQGDSVSKEITWPYPITNVDGVINPTTQVYPNSLINMRDQVIDVVGQVATILPLWMTSKQSDGRVLGFTPAWVIAYVNPGFGQQIAYNIKTQFGSRLNQVDFKVDRYELDRSLSKNWNPVDQSWEPEPAETTFDLLNHYQVAVEGGGQIISGGTNYQVGDKIVVLGTQLGGTTPDNDVQLTVSEIDNIDRPGSIQSVVCYGAAPLFSGGLTYENIAGTNIQSGTGARFTVKRVNLNYFVELTTRGTEYREGDILIILGSQLGGADSVNNCAITVTNVNQDGGILQLTSSGVAAAGVQIYTNQSATKIYGNGATFDFEVTQSDPTVFDDNSLRFIAPVDNYNTQDQFDKYLVFPKRTILK